MTQVPEDPFDKVLLLEDRCGFFFVYSIALLVFVVCSSIHFREYQAGYSYGSHKGMREGFATGYANGTLVGEEVSTNQPMLAFQHVP